MKRNNFQRWIAILFLVLLVNTAYVAAFSSATVFYMANVLFHLVLGVVLAMAVLFTIRKRKDLIAGAPITLGLLFLRCYSAWCSLGKVTSTQTSGCCRLTLLPPGSDCWR
jgi:hypothetical protein